MGISLLSSTLSLRHNVTLRVETMVGTLHYITLAGKLCHNHLFLAIRICRVNTLHAKCMFSCTRDYVRQREVKEKR